MNAAKVEAIANADAHTNNAGLPTYSELVALLKQVRNEARREVVNGHCIRDSINGWLRHIEQ